MKIEINGATLNVEQCGAGEPALVFLHYFGGSSRAWTQVIEPLQSTFRCIAPDLRGFGESESTADGYSLSESADDVAALLKYFEVGNYVLIGHSMGGKIALELASRTPSGLQALVLVAPSPPTPEPMDDAERMRLQSTWRQRDAALETLDKITAKPLPAPLLKIALEDNLLSSAPGWQAWLDGGSREDISDRMSRIEIPVAVLAGAKDSGMTPPLLQREVVARLSDARLIVVPDAAHLLPLEAPQIVADSIREAALMVLPHRTGLTQRPGAKAPG